ncbi:periplasmic nitrate reductase, NapE protein [Halomonas sp. MCCC 1A17488]|uniref:Periplasmic nitrate reductase, NapE protein n=1 Tax=Billgrantia sulfidoxydans TaxID=2733484 RepID=A0ABX7W9L3_9GAMM|nr:MULTISPECIES: periplasmic nitrate reductase, NapE protein [Halomonas]MCE8018376.1 periplasmic nitrate reductase, NapE protein [Halomonas sp. MCCC 1A17488]MCG3241709.1 periplasmic nitrate reductase, NapE protein [Halomonas sp. MCCC 1A17488]QPP49264.1 periplasmic nitrate reductase, NapE protein [Halomonas sp. SS10-MC5]QTP56621.1 periplasmic nitrate reductase, NapE protein [Halomonas sulfidoxydans]
MQRTIDKPSRKRKPQTPEEQQEKKRELLVFLFLAGILFPILAVLVVSGYGFAVWIFQIFAGPPGPPG